MKQLLLLLKKNKINNDLDSFQNGVDLIYNKCISCRSTPVSKTPNAICDSIEEIYNNGSPVISSVNIIEDYQLVNNFSILVYDSDTYTKTVTDGQIKLSKTVSGTTASMKYKISPDLILEAGKIVTIQAKKTNWTIAKCILYNAITGVKISEVTIGTSITNILSITIPNDGKYYLQFTGTAGTWTGTYKLEIMSLSIN